MSSKLKQSVILFVLPVAGVALAGSDPALLGCWRSQQVEMSFTDQSHTNQNGDCVTLYDANQARSHCHNETGEVEILTSYQLTGPGQMRATVLDPATGNPKGPSSDLHYRIEDQWLLVDRQFPAATPGSNNSKQPASFKSVSVREQGNSPCTPRGETGLRIGRTPHSSLALSVPPGWEPILVDPVSNKDLAQAVGSNLFVGAFQQRDGKTSTSGPSKFVVIIDDARSGPVPVRASEFEAVKTRFAEERPAKDLGAIKLICNQPDRLCASLQRPDGALVYTELLNLRGRVVMVNAVATSPPTFDAAAVLPKFVGTFVQQLRADNAK